MFSEKRFTYEVSTAAMSFFRCIIQVAVTERKMYLTTIKDYPPCNICRKKILDQTQQNYKNYETPGENLILKNVQLF